MRYVSSCALMMFILAGGAHAQLTEPAVTPASIFPAERREQKTSYDLQPGEDPQNQLISPFIRHIAEDQEHFWTLPLRARTKDLKWILPAAAGTPGLFAADSWISRQIPNNPSQLNRSLNISNYGVYSLIGAGGGAFIVGEFSHNDHMRETGFLSAEAAINATGVAYAFKFLTERQRPYAGAGESAGEGEFFSHAPGSSNFSFPSEHSAIAWSIASVAAHEYPGPLTEFSAYGLATA